MARRAMLPVAAVLSVAVAACAVPMLTPQQSAQYCAVDVHGPSGAPVFLQSALLDPVAEAVPDVLAGASRVGLAALTLAFWPFGQLLWLGGDPGGAFQSAHLCDPDKLPRPSAVSEFRQVLEATDAQVLAKAVEAALDAPRAACASSRACRDAAAPPDGRLEIEVVSVVAGCLYDPMQYRVDVRWALKNAQTAGKVVANTTQCVLESRRSVEDWLDHPAEAQAEVESALVAVGRRVAAELVIGYPPAAPCVLRFDASGGVDIR